MLVCAQVVTACAPITFMEQELTHARNTAKGKDLTCCITHAASRSLMAYRYLHVHEWAFVCTRSLTEYSPTASAEARRLHCVGADVALGLVEHNHITRGSIALFTCYTFAH